MKIIVCQKLIACPDDIEFDVTQEKLCNIRGILDPIDRHVLEEGLRLRERYGGVIIALSVSPLPGDAILRDALCAGADRAIRVWGPRLDESDVLTCARVIKKVVGEIGFDLILCGVRSSDYGSECLTPTLGHLLNIASTTGIVCIEHIDRNYLRIHKRLLKGERETYRLTRPAVLGLDPLINEPRYVAPFSKTYLSGMLRAVEFFESGLETLPDKQLTTVLRFTQSKPRAKSGINITTLSMEDRLKMMRGELGNRREIFEGSPETAARKIAESLVDFFK